MMYSIFGSGRRFRGDVVVGIREVSASSSLSPVTRWWSMHRRNRFSLEILPQAMKQVARLSEAVGQGRYEELLELLGRHPDKVSADLLDQDGSEEFRVVEGLLLADASGEIVRHPYVNNQLNNCSRAGPSR